MATNEDHMKILEEVDIRAERIMNNSPLALPYGQIGAQMGVAGLYPQQSQQAGPSCAHLIVGYVRQALGGGRERGWWQCVECDAKFVPAGTGPAIYNGH